MKADPSEVLLVDDSDANVAGALHVGIPAVHFQSAQQQATELRKFRLLDT